MTAPPAQILGRFPPPVPAQRPPSRLRRLSRALNPLLLVPGAVFEKEVRAQGRRWGTFLARGMYGALLCGLMCIVFAVFISEMGSQTGARAVQEFQTLAPAMTIAVLWFQFVVLTLIAPTILGPAICDEKRTGTLATLLTTPLTAAQIILGKLAGGLVQIIILALMATPMLLVIRVFGGVPASVIVAGMSVGLSTAVLAACLALAASVGARRGTSAAISGFILALAFHGIPPILMSLMSLMKWKLRINVPMELLFGSSSPVQMWVVTVELMGGGGGPTVSTQWLWVWNSLYSLGLGALAILYATMRLRRVMVLEGAGAPATRTGTLPGAPPPDPDRPAPPTAPGTLARPYKAPALRERPARDVGQNPVLWREVRQPAFSRKWQLPVLVVAIAGLMIWVYSVAGVESRGIHTVVAVIGMVAAMLFAAAMPVGAITGEREARTWETLLTTRLSAREIVLGKIVGALKRQWVLPAMLAVNFTLAGVLTGTLHPLFLFHYALLFAVPAVFLGCTGVLASLVVKRSVHAAVLNTGLAAAIWLGLPLLIAIFGTILRRAGFSGPADWVLTISNPVALAVAAAEGATARNFSLWRLPAGSFQLLGYFGQKGMGSAAFTAVLLLHCTIYGALALGAFALAVRGFRRWSGRA